jgi:hypothetical protein
MFDGAQFLATGDEEVVLRSLDGTAWQQTALETTPWSDVKQLFRGSPRR